MNFEPMAPIVLLLFLLPLILLIIVAVLGLLIPFFILRIRNETIQSNARLGKILNLLEQINTKLCEGTLKKSVPDIQPIPAAKTPAVSTSQASVQQKVIIKEDCIVREAPSNVSRPVSELKSGDKVSIHEIRDEWCRVSSIKKPDKALGWVRKDRI